MSDDTRIGAPRKRKEDPRFLTGGSCFTDDIALDGQLHGTVVRSPHAHARILSIDTSKAEVARGALARGQQHPERVHAASRLAG